MKNNILTSGIFAIVFCLIGLASCNQSEDLVNELDSNKEVAAIEKAVPNVSKSAACAVYDANRVKYYRDTHQLQFGQIKIVNNHGNAYFTIKTYHPDAPGPVQGSYYVGPYQTIYLPGYYGSDWGIQIVYGNGVTSCVKFVGNVTSSYSNNVFTIRASDIFYL